MIGASSAGQKAHRDHLEAVLLGRHDLLAVGGELRLDAEHDRHVRSVDVAVDDADLAAALGEREREVHRHGRLADAAFARADRDDVLHALRSAVARLSAPTASRTRALICTSTADTPGSLQHRRARLIAHLILHRTRRRRQLDRERDAAAVDPQILDEAEAHDVAMKIGIADDLQRIEDRLLVQNHDQSLAQDSGDCRFQDYGFQFLLGIFRRRPHLDARSGC